MIRFLEAVRSVYALVAAPRTIDDRVCFGFAAFMSVEGCHQGLHLLAQRARGDEHRILRCDCDDIGQANNG